MPAAVIPGEGMDLVDDDHAEVREQALRVDAGRDQHHLQRLGGRQQAIGRFAQDPPPCCLFDVSVPERRSPPEQGAIALEPDVEVVQERLDRTDVENAQARPPSVSMRETAGKKALSVFPPAVGARMTRCSPASTEG